MLSFSKKLPIIAVLSLILISCARSPKLGDENTETQPRYRWDALSMQIEKHKQEEGFSPVEKIIRITGSSKDLDERWYLRECFNKISEARTGYSPRDIEGLKGTIRFLVSVDYSGNLIKTLIIVNLHLKLTHYLHRILTHPNSQIMALSLN